MSEFLTPLDAEEIVPDKFWALLKPLRYKSDLYNGIITIPETFPTDFASIPRWPFIYWVLGGIANAPAVLHDFLYNWQGVSRSLADNILLEAMAARGVSWHKRWAIYLGVRVGGWKAWNEDKQKGINWRNYVMPQ